MNSEQQIRPVLDFLNAMSLIKDALNGELKGKLFGMARTDATVIAELFRINFVKNKREKIAKELRNLLIEPILFISDKYKSGAYQTSKRFSDSIISGIKDQKKLKKADEFDEEIQDKAKDKLLLKLENDTDEYVLKISAAMEEGGDGFNEELESEIENVEQETGTYFREIIEDAAAYLGEMADQAIYEAFIAEGIEMQMRWICFFTKSCPDCIERHNDVMSYEEWIDMGLPREYSTACRSRCHCVLVPEAYETDIASPVKLESARLREE